MSEQERKSEYIKELTENEKRKADPTDGMNTYKEMDEELELPEGLAFGMAMNTKAMEQYGRMTPDQRLKVMEESRKAASKEQMTQLVDRIAGNQFQ